MEQALVDFTNVIRALDQRIAQLEQEFKSFVVSSQVNPEVHVEAPVEVPTETQPEPEQISNEVNLDNYSSDTIQNELWMTFKRISDSGQEVIVNYSGEYPRNVIVYASEETQPTYKNNGAAEMRIIQACEGTLIATVQPGESVKTARVDGLWTKIE